MFSSALSLTFLYTLLCVISTSLQLPTSLDDRPGRTALDNFPLIDGHNDLPHNLYMKLNNKLTNFSFDANLSQDSIFGFSTCNSCFTDLPRIKQGKLGAQFWVAFVECNSHTSNLVSRTLEQIDVIRRLVAKYPANMEFVISADGILDAFKQKKLASLIGLEGGHSIEYKLSLLRQYYELGVRYMTLTHTCNLPWADSSLVDDQSGSSISNLTEFGKKIVLEMNRLGMMVDLSHVSHNVMNDAIDVSKAPVIFSHSSAFSVYPHHRNVKDDVLIKMKANDGIVMVNFYSAFVGRGNVTIRNVINHINHIVDIAGVDHVGIGSDFDGIVSVPEGLEDVSKFPHLFDLLKQLNPDRWTIANLEKLAGRNFYRVFKQVEKVRDRMARFSPDDGLIPEKDLAALKTSETSNCVI